MLVTVVVGLAIFDDNLLYIQCILSNPSTSKGLLGALARRRRTAVPASRSTSATAELLIVTPQKKNVLAELLNCYKNTESIPPISQLRCLSTPTIRDTWGGADRPALVSPPRRSLRIAAMNDTDAKKKKKLTHIKLTSHPESGDVLSPIHWGAKTAQERGPVIGTVTNPGKRNVIGAHSGSYAVYRALAIAAGALSPVHIPDLTDTSPAAPIGPYPQWADAKRIISIDPWGHLVSEAFRPLLEAGTDIRPTIAVTRAHINMPEFTDALAHGRLKADGHILKANGEVAVTKAAIDPVWYLPGIAERFGVEEAELRRSLFEYTSGMFPELITRPDRQVFLPPIGGMTAYFFGDVTTMPDTSKELACRIHDECNGSDVFGSDICTCRPYLAHGIEVCIEAAQRGGAGLIVYNRKEGRALGEVTKFLVYNARKRQAGGDTAAQYFNRTECVAGVQDMRFQELMPDILHWLGITKIDKFVSMSNMKYDAIVKTGITIKERVEIPPELIPIDARVEMDAKVAAGYYTPGKVPELSELAQKKCRGLDE